MKITKASNCRTVMFDQVDQGSIIAYSESIYMKIPVVVQAGADNHRNENYLNAVNLETGALRYVPANMLILLVEDYEFKCLL